MTRNPPPAETPETPDGPEFAASAKHRIRWLLVVVLIIALAAVSAAFAFESPDSSSSSPVSASSGPAAPPASGSSPTGTPPNTPPNEKPGKPHESDDSNNSDDSDEPDESDGIVPDNVTVFDTKTPGDTNLDPELLASLRRAAADADAAKGIDFYVNSGWRSPEYQSRLLREAVAKYGSEAEAARWVATPEKSLHVSGDAVDIGKSNATAWLSKNGAKYGLCQIYKNEPWHYELRPEAVTTGCPRMYADPTQDPRLQ